VHQLVDKKNFDKVAAAAARCVWEKKKIVKKKLKYFSLSFFLLPDLLVPNIEISNENGFYLNMKIQFTSKAIVGFIFRVTFRLVSFSTNMELGDVLTNTLEVLHRETKYFSPPFFSF
jgi:hypothetical protein